jgi:hypothetical protein
MSIGEKKIVMGCLAENTKKNFFSSDKSAYKKLLAETETQKHRNKKEEKQ